MNQQAAIIQRQTDTMKMSGFQVLMVAICFVLNLCDGIDVLVVSYSGTEIMKEWGLTKTQLGYVFSAGLTGMTLGCFLLAPMADKLGRRKILLISLLLISGGMLLVSICKWYSVLLLLRFITGLGIGGILPAMAATASEFSNNKYRDFNVALVQAGWPVGAILTGIACTYVIPQYGWRFAFMMAGFISLAMWLIVYFFMGDPISFLLRKQPKDALGKVNTMLSKMKMPLIESLPPKELSGTGTSAKVLFTGNYKNDTLKAWVAAFFGFLTLYTLMSWVPAIARDAGLDFEMATYAGIALNAGAAIGSASVGAIGGRFGLRQTVLTFMLCAFLVMILYGSFSWSTALLFIFIFLIGIFVQGGFNGLWPTFARIYPSEIRTTGVGFAFGIGRLGAILGPALFGYLSDLHYTNAFLFNLFSIPLLIAAFCVFRLKSKNLEIKIDRYTPLTIAK